MTIKKCKCSDSEKHLLDLLLFFVIKNSIVKTLLHAHYLMTSGQFIYEVMISSSIINYVRVIHFSMYRVSKQKEYKFERFLQAAGMGHEPVSTWIHPIAA